MIASVKQRQDAPPGQPVLSVLGPAFDLPVLRVVLGALVERIELLSHGQSHA